MSSVKNLTELVDTVVEKLKRAKESLRETRTPGETSERTGVSSKALEATLKEEMRARKAATRQLETETAERRAMLTEERARSKLNALQINAQAEIIREQARQDNLVRRVGPVSPMMQLMGQANPDRQASSRMIAGMSQSALPFARPLGRLERIRHGIGSMDMGGMALPAALAPLAVPHILEGLGRSMAAGQSPYRTETERSRASQEELPIIGTMIRGLNRFQDALTGVTQAIQTSTVGFREARVRADIATRNAPEMQALEMERATGAYGLRAVQTHGLPGYESFNRSTISGEQQYHEYERRRPLVESQTFAARGTQVSQARVNRARDYAGGRRLVLSQAEAAARQADQRLTEIQQRHDAHAQLPWAQQLVTQPPSASDLNTARQEAALAARTVSGARENWHQAEADARRESAAAIKAESDERKAGIAIMRDQKQVYEEQLQRTRAATQNFGEMGPVGRMQFDVASRLEQQMGFANLPIELQRVIQRGAPEYAARRFQDIGEASPEYRRAQQAGYFGRDTATRADVQAKIDKINTAITVEMKLDAELYAKETAKAVSDNVREIIVSIQARLETALLQLRAEMGLQNQVAGQ